MRFKRPIFVGSLIAVTAATAWAVPARAQGAEDCAHQTVETMRLRFKASEQIYQPGEYVELEATVHRRVKKREMVRSFVGSEPRSQSVPAEGAVVSIALAQGIDIAVGNAITDEKGTARLLVRVPSDAQSGSMKAVGYAWRELGPCVWEVSNWVSRREFIAVQP